METNFLPLLLSEPFAGLYEDLQNSKGGNDLQLVFDLRRDEDGSHAGWDTFTETTGLSREGLVVCCPFSPAWRGAWWLSCCLSHVCGVVWAPCRMDPCGVALCGTRH